LNTCQASFEANLKPPEELAASNEVSESEEMKEKRLKHKMRMLGNIKLVGQLLVKKMIASKVLIAIAEELLSNVSPSTLETLASLLKTAGSTYDEPSFKLHKEFNSIFSRLQKIVKDKSLPLRTRFLLQDVLDLRADGWIDSKVATKKMEGPKKLEEISAEG
jgi:translation initiation factor 4G